MRRRLVSWLLTRTGAQVDMAFVSADSISMLDIAHSLALVNRFHGHTTRPYSVAEHSLLVLRIVARDLRICNPHAQLAALLHDAHEAYCGDLAAPLKPLLGSAWADLEDRTMRAVRRRFGVCLAGEAWASEIKRADLIALATERRDLMPAGGPAWPGLDDVPCADDVDLNDPARLKGWQAWRQQFLDIAAELIPQTTAHAQGEHS